MEWLNLIPINLDMGFIFLGILLCSIAIISWIIFWIGTFETENIQIKESTSTDTLIEKGLIKEMTDITLTNALQSEPSSSLPISENPSKSAFVNNHTFSKNLHDPLPIKEILSTKQSINEEKEPLLNPIISSCNFCKPSPQMASILRAVPSNTSAEKQREAETAI